MSQEEFLSATSMNHFINFPLTGGNGKFSKKLLSEVPAEKADHLLGQCFVLKGEMKRGSGVSTLEFAETLKMSWPLLHKDSSQRYSKCPGHSCTRIVLP
jgi:hypothetical protein